MEEHSKNLNDSNDLNEQFRKNLGSNSVFFQDKKSTAQLSKIIANDLPKKDSKKV